ncbi:MAG: hypothetical protein ACM3SR_03390 [Ignavibacteriales bacterium]
MEKQTENKKDKPRNERLIVESKNTGSVTYHLTKIYYGNSRRKSCPHGPYWYAYYREGNKVISKYIGKNFRFLEKP